MSNFKEILLQVKLTGFDYLAVFINTLLCVIVKCWYFNFQDNQV